MSPPQTPLRPPPQDAIASFKAALSKQSPPVAAFDALPTHDIFNRAVWLRFDPRALRACRPQATAAADQAGLFHPKDRVARVVSDRYSTRAVEEALEEYREAVGRARDEAARLLQELAVALQPALPQLVSAAHVSIIATALISHTETALRQGWTLPQLQPVSGSSNGAHGRAADGAPPAPPPSSSTSKGKRWPPQQAAVAVANVPPPTATSSLEPAADSSPSSSFVIRDMWPYWLPRDGRSTVLNSFDLDAMFLLTGPNTAGKSTVLRSTCAVALLANCGLFVPAARAVVPRFDAFVLRNFSGRCSTGIVSARRAVASTVDGVEMLGLVIQGSRALPCYFFVLSRWPVNN